MTGPQAFRVFVEMAHYYCDILSEDDPNDGFRQLRRKLDALVLAKTELFQDMDADETRQVVEDGMEIFREAHDVPRKREKMMAAAILALPWEYGEKLSALALQLLYVGVTPRNYEKTMKISEMFCTIFPIKEEAARTVVSVLELIYAPS